MKKPLVLVSIVFIAALFFVISNTLGPQEATLEGIYEYVYEHNSEDYSENHYIQFKVENGELHGIYYGTSDDFDEAREGYLPGFFKTTMENLQHAGQLLKFDLYVSNAEMLNKPVTPLKEEKHNSAWGYGDKKIQRSFEGKIEGDTITINKPDFHPRVFKKIFD